MKVLLINLDRHRDRLAHMCKQLSGIPFERIAAVDGSSMPETVRGLTRFELACLESHRIAWRHFLKSSEDRICVVEDDLHVWPGFAELVGDGAWTPVDAHCVKLDTYRQKVRLGERSPALSSREIARLYTRHHSSAAYVMTRRGAERYLELTAKPKAPADYALFPKNPRRLGLCIYQLVPAIAIQDHLVAREDGGQRFATTMTEVQGDRARRWRVLRPSKLGRETARFATKFVDLIQAAYEKASLRVETTTVPVG